MKEISLFNFNIKLNLNCDCWIVPYPRRELKNSAPNIHITCAPLQQTGTFPDRRWLLISTRCGRLIIISLTRFHVRCSVIVLMSTEADAEGQGLLWSQLYSNQFFQHCAVFPKYEITLLLFLSLSGQMPRVQNRVIFRFKQAISGPGPPKPESSVCPNTCLLMAVCGKQSWLSVFRWSVGLFRGI